MKLSVLLIFPFFQRATLPPLLPPGEGLLSAQLKEAFLRLVISVKCFFSVALLDFLFLFGELSYKMLFLGSVFCFVCLGVLLL